MAHLRRLLQPVCLETSLRHRAGALSASHLTLTNERHVLLTTTTTPPIVELSGINMTFGEKERRQDDQDPRRHQPHCAGERCDGAARPLRLRQVDDHAHPFRPDSTDQRRGEISSGTPLDGVNPGVAMVFQNFALFPWLTVRENILLGVENSELQPRGSEAAAFPKNHRDGRARRLRRRACRRNFPAA